MLAKNAPSRPSRAPRRRSLRRAARLAIAVVAAESLESRQLLAGDGLSVAYFDNANFTGAVAAAVAPTVDVNWGTAAPAAGIQADSWAARWAGRVEAVEGGTYTFRTTTDDGVRLWVDDRLVIDKWVNQGPTPWTGTVALAAGKRHHIVMEYYDATGGASAKLEWLRPGQGAYAVVPQAQLYSDRRAFPSDAVFNVKAAYGAVGDGIADDTAAIQAAMNALRGTNKTLYFPSGTYRLTNTVTLGNVVASAKRFVMQGENRDNVVLKLDDAAAGFGDPLARKPLVSFYDGTSGSGQGFVNSVYDLTIDAGARNPGVVALKFMNNNQGSIRDVTLRAAPDATDGNKRKGVAGLDLTAPWPGPGMVRNVLVDGFDRGVNLAHYEFSMTFEDVTLQNQLQHGVWNEHNVLNFRNLKSRNTVPAVFTNQSAGQVVLIDSSLTGGLPANSAVTNKGGLFARNLTTSGYGKAIDNQTGSNIDVTGPNVAEYVSHTVYGEFPKTGTSVNLPIEDAPEAPSDDPSLWVRVDPAAADDTAAVQAAIDSANALGRSTVYFPHGTYTVSGTINVTGGVRRIIGNGATMNAAAPFNTSGAAMFRVSGTTGPVTIERISFGTGGTGFFLFEQATAQPLVIRNVLAFAGQAYKSTGTVGTLFVEDVASSRWQFNNQKVFMRQVNPESDAFTNIVANNSQVWAMGVKTEYGQTTIDATGGSTEVLGALLYPAGYTVPADRPAFKFTDSRASVTFAVSGSRVYTVLVRETRAGVTNDLLRTEVGTPRGSTGLPLFSGVAPVTAGTIAEYGFAGSSDAASNVITGVTASATTATGFTNVGFFSGATGAASGAPARTADGMNAAFNAATRFFAFTFTPTAGKVLSLSSFAFKYARENTNSATGWRLRSSLDGYTSDLATPGALTGTGTALQSASASLSLTGITTAVTFRLYFYGAAGSGSDLRVDDIRFDGSVA